MIQGKDYFFCGVGGSGMTPLALIVKARGGHVEGSDRALDQGRNLDRFDYLRSRGVALHPQDGSGVVRQGQIVVCSAAVEESVPDVQAARRVGAQVIVRAQLLAELFNGAPVSIGVAGTSGKSTTCAMAGWILTQTGRDPTIVNGAEMKNFVTRDAPFAAVRVGGETIFVGEVDESDGSIALYRPKVAVVNNISLDHKSMDELRRLFRDFADKADVAVLNLDNGETRALAGALGPKALTYSQSDEAADLVGHDPVLSPAGVAFGVTERKTGESAPVVLQVPGLHNLANALAAVGAARAVGVSLKDAAAALGSFTGVRRRLEVAGAAAGVVVIDDFAHNPDKIAATLDALHAFPGRLLLMFQPHGYGPLAKMKRELAEAFAGRMTPEDVLLMPEPVYFGGTTDRSVGSAEVVAEVVALGRQAFALSDRAACGERLLELAQDGDRIVVMGARDDSLSVFAKGLVERLGG